MSLKFVLMGLGFAYFAVFGLAAVVFFDFQKGQPEQRLAEVQKYLEHCEPPLAMARRNEKAWHDHVDRLNAARIAQERYAEACRKHRRVQKYLADTDWRSLRGIPFEEFLADVFRALGYEVKKTRATGDHGADLIVTGKGRRIAVQAKGYGGTVGNDAVQEAHFSKSMYQCEICVAITNSSFTRAAREAAHAVNCVLIDGNRLPEFIEGKIM